MPARKSKSDNPNPMPPAESVGTSRGADRSPKPHQGPLLVGIGASAGGLQALQSFFDALSSHTGMSFVVITHLHPEHESYLAEILQSHTEMPVEQVRRKTTIKPDHVYVMPPNRRLLLSDSQLGLAEFTEAHGRRMPVDSFFRSIAAAHRDAIGIILSGSGTDGSVGIKDVKSDGGLLLVQDPEEAEYDGMPRAAISTGLADLILPVKDLAAKLLEYSQRQPELPSDPEKLTKEQQTAIEKILAQVHARTGNDFAHYKRSTVLRRIQRRMQLNGFKGADDYLDYLRRDSAEATAIFNDLLIGVTNFFRDRPSWDALARKVIPPLFQNKRTGNPVRVWSVGCATGEEAYGLAMLLFEHVATLDRHYDLQVFASDLAESSLVQAREGLYPSAIEADVSQERLERFFVREGDHYRVKRQLRDTVLFTNHNILRDPPFSHIDLVVCRNLLIYLHRDVQDKIFEIFYYALEPGGFLFLGNSESADLVPDLFSVVDRPHRIYHARPWKGRQPRVPVLPLTLPARAAPARSPRPQSSPTSRVESQDTSRARGEHEAALEQQAPPSVLVDARYEILHVSETAGHFLLQPKGPPTLDLLHLVRRELRPELQAALFQAFERNRATLSRQVFVRFNGYSHRVAVCVKPTSAGAVDSDELMEKQALVFFLEDEFEESTESLKAAETGTEAERAARILQLEGEVLQLRDQLQALSEAYNSSNEEMKAANEELQSINEEYRSTTEELETSKEELQSVNEELQTVNNELKDKVEQVTAANNDLENLMSASEIATLFLNRDLRIKRYTRGMDQVLGLVPSDRGRPVGDLANKLGYDDLLEDAQQVLRNLVMVERELQSPDGRWFQARLRPYRTLDHRIDGVVITFVDITEIKHAHHELQVVNATLQQRVEQRTAEVELANQQLSQANGMFSTLLNANPIPTSLVRIEDRVYLDVDDAYLAYYGLQRDHVVGRSVVEVPGTVEAQLLRDMDPRLLQDGETRSFETQLEKEGQPKRTFLTAIHPIKMYDKPAALVAAIDITERVQAEERLRLMASELTEAEQRERHRISQVLHDDLQQRLFAIRMQISFLREASEGVAQGGYQVNLPELEKWVTDAIQTTRNLSIDLSPVILHGEGLADALVWLASQMQEQFGLEVAVNAEDAAIDLPRSLRTLLFQAIRELLFNVVKHARTLHASITIKRLDQHIRILVSDDGVGFDAREVMSAPEVAHGLPSIVNRLAIFGCTLHVKSEINGGTHIRIDVPRQLLQPDKSI